MNSLAKTLALIFLVLSMISCGGEGSNPFAVPAPGNYVGTYNVFVDGAVIGSGSVRAGNLDSAGNVMLALAPGSGTSTTGVFTGQLVPGGSLLNAFYNDGGTIIGEEDATFLGDESGFVLTLNHLTLDGAQVVISVGPFAVSEPLPELTVPAEGSYHGTYHVFHLGALVGAGNLGTTTVDAEGEVTMQVGHTYGPDNLEGVATGIFAEAEGHFDGRYVLNGNVITPTAAGFTSDPTKFRLIYDSVPSEGTRIIFDCEVNE